MTSTTPRGPKTYTAKDWIAPGIFLLLVLLALGWASTRPPAEPEAPPKPRLQAAAEACGLSGNVRDGGKTLLFDTQGSEDTTGDSMSAVGCVLNALGTPSSVTSHMDSTRALDGMQTDSWNGIDARWTFHPQAGWTMTLTE